MPTGWENTINEKELFEKDFFQGNQTFQRHYAHFSLISHPAYLILKNLVTCCHQEEIIIIDGSFNKR